MNDTKLTIAVITMNRSTQLIEALDSCLNCELPQNTEFVILDNASTDDTRKKINEYRNIHSDVDIKVFFSNSNLGVGGGRNFVFEKANGQYVYFLDDDAVIDTNCKRRFFLDSIEFLDSNTKVASLSTYIYDELLGHNRVEVNESNIYLGNPLLMTFLGGSHFLRKNVFSAPLYFDIIYGSEEYAPSIYAINNGYCHLLDKSIQIIHRPKVNKWAEGSAQLRDVQIRCVAVVYATKRLLYPKIFHPIIWMGYFYRSTKYLSGYKGAKADAKRLVKKIIMDNKCAKQVKVSTVINMYRLFGCSAL